MGAAVRDVIGGAAIKKKKKQTTKNHLRCFGNEKLLAGK